MRWWGIEEEIKNDDDDDDNENGAGMKKDGLPLVIIVHLVD